MTPGRDMNNYSKGRTEVKKTSEVYGLDDLSGEAMALCRVGFGNEASTRIRTKPSKRRQQHGSSTKSCTKRAFRNRDQVKQAVTRNRYARVRQEAEGGQSMRLENRYWFCGKCFAYHLTSKPKYEAREEIKDVA